MELSQIRIFKAVADSGSVVRASALLNCVPSNVTARIKALEQELGVVLFHREGRGLRISASGRMFLCYANKILALAAESRRMLDPLSVPGGGLKIGAIESSAMGRLPHFLVQFHARFPQVSLQLRSAPWSILLEQLERHELDGAIIAVDVERDFLCRSPIYEEQLQLIAPSTLGPLRGAHDLQGKTIFMWPDGCPYRAALTAWLRKHGLSLPIMSFASYGAIIGCVRVGGGVALVPAGIVGRYCDTSELVYHSFPDLTPVRNFFVWHRDAACHPAREAFASLLQEQLNFPRSSGTAV